MIPRNIPTKHTVVWTEWKFLRVSSLSCVCNLGRKKKIKKHAILQHGEVRSSYIVGGTTSPLSFILVFISNPFYFHITTVLSNTFISVSFIRIASNHFYIYFIIFLSNTIIFICMTVMQWTLNQKSFGFV